MLPRARDTSGTLCSPVSPFALARAPARCYNDLVLNTPVTKLRKAAPGSLTAAELAAYFKRKRYPRTRVAITAFELGATQNPPDRFLEIYAEGVGQSVAVVREAHQRTVRMRERRSGPFAV
jgi:hypothetical protein